MKYKVGDRVRIISSVFGLHCNHICTIIKVMSENESYPYRVRDDKGSWNCLMLDCELKPAIEIGQQLEFDFMEEE